MRAPPWLDRAGRALRLTLRIANVGAMTLDR
jgi:hypothetical protein